MGKSKDLNEIGKTITLNEFGKRFEEMPQGFKDNSTGKIYYCPADIGFKFTREDCNELNGECKKCWEAAKESMSYRG